MAYQSIDLITEIRVTLDKKDEIQKLMLEEDLSETKRSQYLLMKGQPRQKLAVYQNLGKLLSKGFDSLFNYVQADIMEQNDELIIEAGKSLKSVNNHAKELLSLTLHFLSLYNLQVAEAWLPTFGNLIKRIDYQEYEVFIENMIMDMSKAHQPEVGRLIGAMMIMQVAEFQGEKISLTLLGRVRQLCNDSDEEVRSLIAGDVLICLLPKLTPVLIQQYFEDKFQPLIYDSSTKVKQSMIQTFFVFLEKINRNQNQLDPAQIFIDSLSTSNEDVLTTSLKYCGQAYAAISGGLEFQQKFVDLYTKFGYHLNQEIRKLYLYNLPGIMKFTEDEKLRQKLFQPFCTIIDEDVIENKILSCKILHELAKIFDHDFNSTHIFLILTNILNSGSQCILHIQIDQIVQRLYQNDSTIPFNKIVINQYNQQTQYKSIFQEYSKLFSKFNSNYITNLTYLQHVQKFQKFVKVRQFEKYFLTLLYQKQACPFNDQLAMEIVAQFFGSCKSYDLQNKIKDIMNLMFMKGNFNKKIKYLSFISYLPLHISKKYFLQLNFYHLMGFAKDKAINVIIQLIKILPKVYHYLPEQNEYKTLKNLITGTTLTNLVEEMILTISQHEKTIDPAEQRNFEQQEDNNYQAYLTSLKSNKQQESSSMSIDYHTKPKKKPIPKLSQTSAKKGVSTSHLKIEKQNSITIQSKSQDRVPHQPVAVTKFRARPSGFNKF